MLARKVFGLLVKKCSRCGEEFTGLEVDENFSTNSTKKDGFQSECRKCRGGGEVEAWVVEAPEVRWYNYPTKRNLSQEHLLLIEKAIERKKRNIFVGDGLGGFWRWGARKKMERFLEVYREFRYL